MESLLVALEALKVVCRVYWKAQPLSINPLVGDCSKSGKTGVKLGRRENPEEADDLR